MKKWQIIVQCRVHASQIVKTATSVDSHVGYSAVRRFLHGRLACVRVGGFGMFRRTWEGGFAKLCEM